MTSIIERKIRIQIHVGSLTAESLAGINEVEEDCI